MTKKLEHIAKQAQALVERLQRGSPWKPGERAGMCDDAVVLARQAQQPLLEAQALLAQYRFRAPFADAPVALERLRLAERIFVANHRPLEAARCRIEQTCALADLGQELLATHLASQVLQTLNLPIDDQLHLHLVIAACHLHTGDIDASWRQLEGSARPLSRLGALPALQAKLAWRQGMTLMAGLIAKHQKDLWLTYGGSLGTTPRAGMLSDALALMDEAERLVPPGESSGYLRWARFGGLALLGDEDVAPAELEKVGDEARDADPPLAVRVHFIRGLVLLRQGQARRALTVLEMAFDLATAWGQLALTRDIALHQSQVHEGLGDAAAALKALKAHAHMLATSLQHQPLLSDAAPVPRTELAGGHERPGGDPVAPAMMPEPPCVQAAERFLVAHAGRPIQVVEVVAHCGVSRRTLEMALRRARMMSVTELILAHQMNRAARALQLTRRSVVDIAWDAGYRSASAFAREFRQRFGVAPAQWRKRPVEVAPA